MNRRKQKGTHRKAGHLSVEGRGEAGQGLVGQGKEGRKEEDLGHHCSCDIRPFPKKFQGPDNRVSGYTGGHQATFLKPWSNNIIVN